MIQLTITTTFRLVLLTVTVIVAFVAVGCGSSDEEAIAEFAQCTLDNGYLFNAEVKFDVIDYGSKANVLAELASGGRPSDEDVVVARRIAVLSEQIRNGELSMEYLADLQKVLCE